MPRGLGAVAARRHVAPPTTAGPRRVVEDPVAGVAGAGLDTLRLPFGKLEDERLRQPRKRVVDRIADMAVVDAAAVGRRDELDDLARVERAIDGFERARVGRTVLRDRVRDVAEGRTDAVDAGEFSRLDRCMGRGLGTDAIGAFGVDDAPIDEPAERAVEGRKLLDPETVIGVVSVQEVEGVLEVDVVGVSPTRLVEHLDIHLDNHSTPLDRLRARGYITRVTD